MKIKVRRYRAPIRKKLSGLLAISVIALLLFLMVAYLKGIMNVTLFPVLQVLLAIIYYLTYKDLGEVTIPGVHDVSALQPLFTEVFDQLEYAPADEEGNRMIFASKNQKKERLMRLFSGLPSTIIMEWADHTVMLTGPSNKIRDVEDKLEFNPRVKVALQEASAQ